MNFILRRITSEGRVNNQIMSDSYQLVFDDRPILSSGNFDETITTPLYESYKSLNDGYSRDIQEQIHMFILWNDGQNWMPIYKKSQYYIMTENGKTFDTIKRFWASIYVLPQDA